MHGITRKGSCNGDQRSYAPRFQPSGTNANRQLSTEQQLGMSQNWSQDATLTGASNFRMVAQSERQSQAMRVTGRVVE